MQDSNIDPIAFFDHLAAASQSSEEEQETKRQLETMKPQPKDPHFEKMWHDFVQHYKQEKEALDENLQYQLNALRQVDDHFDKANLELHNKIQNTFHELSNDIQAHQHQLDIQQQHFEKEKELIREIRTFQNEKVKLNVGGQLFETSLTTLRKDPNSMLATMFGEHSQMIPDADDSYFIDRDSTYFRLVLNYLRDLRIPSGITDDPKVMDELMQEAKFYRLYDLLKLKWIHLPVMTQEELYDLYPISSPGKYKPVIMHLEKKNLAHLDFSHYHIDPRSSFAESNLEHCQFINTKFGFDFEHQVNFSHAFLIGVSFPEEGSLNRPSGVQFNVEGAIMPL